MLQIIAFLVNSPAGNAVTYRNIKIRSQGVKEVRELRR